MTRRERPASKPKRPNPANLPDHGFDSEAVRERIDALSADLDRMLEDK